MRNYEENGALNDDSLMTPNEAAGWLKFSTRKLRYEVKAGRIAFVQLGRQVRFIRDDLDAYVQDHRIC